MLESLSCRAVMGSLHGMFSLGGLAGAALAAMLLRHDIAPALQLAGIAVAVTLMSLGASRAMLDAHPKPECAEAHFAWPRGALLLIGLLIFAGLALVVPLLYNAATRVPGVSRAAAIASVSSVGYTGLLIGPPAIGVVAHANLLGAAMGLVVVAAVALTLVSGGLHEPAAECNTLTNRRELV